MAIEIYQGKNVTAEDAAKFFDLPTIIHSCNKLKEAASILETTGKKIIDAKDYCTREALFMQGESFEEPIEFCGKDFNDISSYISDFAETILEATNKAMEKKQLLLNEEARVFDQHANIMTDNQITE